MGDSSTTDESHRVASTDDLEVSTYLEIAQENKKDDLKLKASSVSAADMVNKPETIVIIDFGSQYSRLIARRLRENHAYCEIVSYDSPREICEKFNLKGIILSGGPSSVYEENAPVAPAWVFDSNVPVLGICYGMQLIAHQLGGVVAEGREREYGHAVITQSGDNSPLFADLAEELPVWMSHGDRIDV